MKPVKTKTKTTASSQILYHRFLLASILLVALLLRLISLNQSLWLDEAIQAWSASLSLKNLFTNYLPGDFNPPLIHLLTWVSVAVFGNREIFLRLPSVLAGVGTVYFTFRLSQKLIQSRSLSYLSAALIAINPLLIYYSQEARMYSLAVFFTTWSMYEFYQLLKTNSRNLNLKNQKNKLLVVRYFIATSLMFFSHYLAWFIYPTQLLILFITSYKSKALLQKLQLFALPLFSVLLILPLLIAQLKTGLATSANLSVWQSLGAFSLRQLALIPSKILVGRLPIEFNFVFLIFFSLSLFLWAFIVFKNLKPKPLLTFIRSHHELTFLLSWLIVPVIIGALVSVKIPVFYYFRFIYIAPAFYLLLVCGLAKASPKLKIFTIAFFLVLSVFSSFSYLLNSTFHREDWRSLVAYVHYYSAQSDNKVLILSAVNRPFWYYDQDQSQLYDYSEFESNLRFNKYLWLVKYGQPIFEPDNRTETKVKAYGFIPIKQQTFRGDLTLKLMYNPLFLTAHNQNSDNRQ